MNDLVKMFGINIDWLRDLVFLVQKINLCKGDRLYGALDVIH